MRQPQSITHSDPLLISEKDSSPFTVPDTSSWDEFPDSGHTRKKILKTATLPSTSSSTQPSSDGQQLTDDPPSSSSDQPLDGDDAAGINTLKLLKLLMLLGDHQSSFFECNEHTLITLALNFHSLIFILLKIMAVVEKILADSSHHGQTVLLNCCAKNTFLN